MKKRLFTTRAVNYIVAALFLFFIVSIFFIFQSRPGSESTSYSYKELPPIDPVVSDSLPYYKYKRLKEEIDFGRQAKNGIVNSSSSDNFFTGFTAYKRCDTCSNFNDFWKVEGEWDYIIRMKWWELDTGSFIQPLTYYVKNGQSFVRKVKCESKSKSINGNNQSYYNCKQTDFKVSFRYDKKEKGIMIPVSKKTLDIFKPIFMIVAWGGTLSCLYFMLTAFVNVLVDIRNGDPFSEANVKQLRWLTILFFSVPIVLFLLNLSMRLIFHKYFTEDIKLSSDAWLIFWKPFVLGIIFAALHSAFKRGKQLKEEQDLTI